MPWADVRASPAQAKRHDRARDPALGRKQAHSGQPFPPPTGTAQLRRHCRQTGSVGPKLRGLCTAQPGRRLTALAPNRTDLCGTSMPFKRHTVSGGPVGNRAIFPGSRALSTFASELGEGSQLMSRPRFRPPDQVGSKRGCALSCFWKGVTVSVSRTRGARSTLDVVLRWKRRRRSTFHKLAQASAAHCLSKQSAQTSRRCSPVCRVIIMPSGTAWQRDTSDIAPRALAHRSSTRSPSCARARACYTLQNRRLAGVLLHRCHRTGRTCTCQWPEPVIVGADNAALLGNAPQSGRRQRPVCQTIAAGRAARQRRKLCLPLR
jgi:hypothetical protein